MPTFIYNKAAERFAAAEAAAVEDFNRALSVGAQIEAMIMAHAQYLEESRKLAAMLPEDKAIVFGQVVELEVSDFWTSDTLLLEIPAWRVGAREWDLQKPGQQEEAN